MKKAYFPLLRKAIKQGTLIGLERVDELYITNNEAIIAEITEAILEQIEELYNFEHE
jgi:hypothetical protein